MEEQEKTVGALRHAKNSFETEISSLKHNQEQILSQMLEQHVLEVRKNWEIIKIITIQQTNSRESVFIRLNLNKQHYQSLVFL